MKKPLLVGMMIPLPLLAVFAQEALNVTRLGGFEHWTPGAVQAAGSLLVAVAGYDGVQFVDAADPSAPIRRGSAVPVGFAWDLRLVDSSAVIAAGWGGVAYVDFTDLRQPRQALIYDDWDGEARCLETRGDWVFVGYSSGALLAIECLNPAGDPRDVVSVDVDFSPDRLIWSGDYLCAIDDTTGLHLFDVSQIQNITRVGGIDIEPRITGAESRGELIYLGTAAGIYILDLANPRNILTIGTFREMQLNADGIEIVDEMLYVADVNNRLFVLDVAEPRDVQLAALSPMDIRKPLGRFSENFLAAGTMRGGFSFLDIADPDQPLQTGIYTLGGTVHQVAAHGAYAVIMSNSKLTLVDWTIPAEPQITASASHQGNGYPLVIDDSYIYLPTQNQLEIYDYRNPFQLQLVGAVNGISPRDLVVADGTAFAVTNAELWTLDVTRPRQPQILGRLQYHGYAFTRGVAVSGDFVFVACAYAGLRIVDASDLRRPMEISYVNLPGLSHAVDVQNGIAYVLDWNGGLSVVDVSDPEAPRLLSRVDTPIGRSLAVAGNYAILACDWAGTRVMDVSDPNQPREVGYFDVDNDAAKSIDAIGDFLFSGGGSRFDILENRSRFASILSGPSSANKFQLFAAYPNPFNTALTVSYSLAYAGFVRLGVYSLNGAVVAELSPGFLVAGNHSTIWDAAGAASGIYYIMLSSPHGEAVQSVLRVK